jgi:hypothetical protein
MVEIQQQSFISYDPNNRQAFQAEVAKKVNNASFRNSLPTFNESRPKLYTRISPQPHYMKTTESHATR